LTGVRRPREETSVEEEGGAPKLQGIGSPTRPGGSGIKKKVAAPQSILRNKSQNRSSASKEMDRPGTQANRRMAPAEHDRAVAGASLPPPPKSPAQRNRRSPSASAGSKTLSSQGLKPKSTPRRVQRSKDSTREVNEDNSSTSTGEADTEERRSRSSTKVGWKAAVETSKREESVIKRTPWTETGFFDFLVELPPNLKGGGQASTKFKDKMASMLSMLRNIDSAGCILHPKEPEKSSVYARKDFHDMYYNWGAFFRFDNDGAFANGTKEKARVIRGSVMLGLAKDCRQTIKMLFTDISIVSGVKLYWKDLQALDTRKKIALPCAPIKIPATHVQEMLIQLMEKWEAVFVEKYPSRFPSSVHTGKLPPIVVKLNWAEGTPWSDPKKRSTDDTSHRKVFQIETKVDDQPRLVNLVKEIKKKGYEKDIFGESCYLAFQPDRDATPDHKKVWERKVKYSGTVMMNQGSVEFNGLEFPDAEVQMEMVDPNLPQPGKMSIRMVLTKMKGPGKKRFWQCIAPNWDGIYTGTFIGKDEESLELAAEYSACCASQVRVLLQRRGFTRDSVAKLIYEAFDDKRQSSAAKAKWDTRRRKVIPGYAAVDEMLSMEGDDRLDITLGMTTEEKAEYAQAQVRRAALNVDMPEGDEANMEAFRMNENSSVAGTVAAERSVAGFSLGAKSIFSFGSGDLESLDNEMEMAGRTEPEEEEGGHKYVFEMPMDGIGEGMEKGSDNMDTSKWKGNQEKTSSDGSHMSPRNLEQDLGLGGPSDEEDTLSILHMESIGVRHDSLVGLRCHVSGEFSRYNIKGWSEVVIMIGEFGGEIVEAVDESTDVVIMGAEANQGVVDEAGRWRTPIIGVEAIKNGIRGRVNIRSILEDNNMSVREKELALQLMEETDDVGNNNTVEVSSTESLDSNGNPTKKGKELAPGTMEETGNAENSSALDISSTNLQKTDKTTPNELENSEPVGDEGGGQERSAMMDTAGVGNRDVEGWDFNMNEQELENEGIHIKTSTPTSGSLGERTDEPSPETSGEETLLRPKAQEAGEMGSDSSRPG